MRQYLLASDHYDRDPAEPWISVPASAVPGVSVGDEIALVVPDGDVQTLTVEAVIWADGAYTRLDLRLRPQQDATT